MEKKKIVLFALTVFLMIIVSADTFCLEQNPGSCLLYPYFSTNPTNMTIMTITNVGNQNTWVRMVWVEKNSCAPESFWVLLTPLDTFTFLDSALIPMPNTEGFVYAYACSGEFEKDEVDYDFLIGQAFTLEADPIGNISFTTNAQSFKGIQVISDGKLHLDGTEYEPAAAQLYIPHFFGQPDAGMGGAIQSKIILINLTGGQFFRVRAQYVVCNDNEVPFAGETEFRCWEKWDLNQFSMATWRSFLLASLHNVAEPVGLPPQAESGWIQLRGIVAWNPTNPIYFFDNPSICVVLFEGIQSWAYGADFPFQIEDPTSYNNAMLWSTQPDGL